MAFTCLLALIAVFSLPLQVHLLHLNLFCFLCLPFLSQDCLVLLLSLIPLFSSHFLSIIFVSAYSFLRLLSLIYIIFPSVLFASLLGLSLFVFASLHLFPSDPLFNCTSYSHSVSVSLSLSVLPVLPACPVV